MTPVEHILLPIEHCFVVFSFYFCSRKEKNRTLWIFLSSNQERVQVLFAWVIATSWCWWIALAVCLLAE